MTLRVTLARFIAGGPMPTLTFCFYNLREGRPAEQVGRELEGLAGFLRPAVLAGVEAVGYYLPAVKGYDLIRDRSTPSRANVFAYVKQGRTLSGVHWRDFTKTWKATEHPGQHDPRSALRFRLDGVKVLVNHQPPVTRVGDTAAAREETRAWVVDQFEVTMEGRPVVALGDWNDSHPPTASEIAKQVGGWAVGRTVDKAIVRNATAKDFSLVAAVKWLGKWILMRSDHKHALLTHVKVDRKWWPSR